MDISAGRKHRKLSVSSYNRSEICRDIPAWSIDYLGFYCPGCGGTRAVSALLTGHPLSATWYHPLVTYTVVIFGGFMLSQTLARLHIGGIKGWRFHEWHLYAAVGIMIGNFILKNILLLKFHITL